MFKKKGISKKEDIIKETVEENVKKPKHLVDEIEKLTKDLNQKLNKTEAGEIEEDQFIDVVTCKVCKEKWMILHEEDSKEW